MELLNSTYTTTFLERSSNNTSLRFNVTLAFYLSLSFSLSLSLQCVLHLPCPSLGLPCLLSFSYPPVPSPLLLALRSPLSVPLSLSCSSGSCFLFTLYFLLFLCPHLVTVALLLLAPMQYMCGAQARRQRNVGQNNSMVRRSRTAGNGSWNHKSFSHCFES